MGLATVARRPRSRHPQAGADDPSSRITLRDAEIEHYWELFLAGYKAGDPDSKAEFDRTAPLNRATRRRMASGARKLRNRSGSR